MIESAVFPRARSIGRVIATTARERATFNAV
jgi:hypothetical protein